MNLKIKNEKLYVDEKYFDFDSKFNREEKVLDIQYFEDDPIIYLESFSYIVEFINFGKDVNGIQERYYNKKDKLLHYELYRFNDSYIYKTYFYKDNNLECIVKWEHYTNIFYYKCHREIYPAYIHYSNLEEKETINIKWYNNGQEITAEVLDYLNKNKLCWKNIPEDHQIYMKLKFW